MLQRSEKGITLKVTLKYFCHRLIRIQPLHMYSICLLVGLYSVTSWGSLWEISKFQVDNCRQLWWSNLLLLNNFISVTESCNGWTWYLANDFQFYLTTPLVIFLYTRSKHGLIVLGIILLLATFTVTGLLSAFFRLPVASPSDMSVAGLERVIQESQKEDVVMFLLSYPQELPWDVENPGSNLSFTCGDLNYISREWPKYQDQPI
ncbi:nose resistant to fluoxetine protein 6-like [Alligator mississippiensis]|uniref:Nose resistant to fluoxetine protein 6-like n=1 Tax=Alligator mississippiensis TaxID=8496 RepID=A0A151MWZ2_ALLMI|nr:nose resistant to fluoxetine protein 6-like [Alligator mississippiensis]